jgi:hypothetical protein
MNTYQVYIDLLLNPASNEEAFLVAAEWLSQRDFVPENDEVGRLALVARRFIELVDPSTALGMKSTAAGDASLGSRIGKMLSTCGEPALVELRRRLADNHACGKYNHPGLLAALAACGGAGDVISVLNGNPDCYERMHAAEALGRGGPTEVVLPALAGALRDPETNVRQQVVFWFFEKLSELTGTTDALPFLMKLCEAMSRDEFVRETACYEYRLRYGPGRRQPPPVFELNYVMVSGSAGVRSMAAELLRESSPP